MTKEELETREKLKLMNIAKGWLRTEHPEGNVQSLVNLILSFTEPREKQIQIDAEQIRALQKQNGELTDKVKELEAQIEKMKCCGNCKNLKGRFDRNTNINILYCSDSDMKQIEVGFQMCCCKWEIKEK